MSRASFLAIAGAIARTSEASRNSISKPPLSCSRFTSAGGPYPAALVITSQIGCHTCLCVLPFAATCPLLCGGNKRDGPLKKDAHDEGSPHPLVVMDATADCRDVDDPHRSRGNNR